MTEAEAPSCQDSDRPGLPATAHDPVCGMTVDPATAQRAEHAGRGLAAGEVRWTCPMHPQIVRREPGNCPICGMALEPMTPAAGAAENPELRDMTRRFWVGVALSVPLLGLAMAEQVNEPGLAALISARLLGLGAVDPRHAGRAVGRLAVLPARLGLDRRTAGSTCSR